MEGYEASFLVLGGDPIDDFTQVQAIRRRVKQGVPLEGYDVRDTVSPGAEHLVH